MFERNRIDSIDQGLITVTLIMTDGQELVGKLTIPAGRPLFDFFNGPNAYIEFEPFDGEKTILSKTAISGIRGVNVPKGVNIAQRLRDLDGFDPYSILSVDRTADWDAIRAAYLQKSKLYHPDRWSTADLPEEVTGYLAGMARRINAAYATLEAAQAQRRTSTAQRAAPVYVSPAARAARPMA